MFSPICPAAFPHSSRAYLSFQVLYLIVSLLFIQGAYYLLILTNLFERDIFHPLIDSSNDYKSQSWERWNPGTSSSIWISHMVAGTYVDGPLLPARVHDGGIRSGIWGSDPVTPTQNAGVTCCILTIVPNTHPGLAILVLWCYY